MAGIDDTVSASSAAAAGRVAAERLMTDTFTVESFEMTKVDGLETQAWVYQYQTPGRVAGPSAQTADTTTRTVTVGGVERLEIQGGLHIPIGAPLPEVGWQFECTAVGPGSDPSLVGRRWQVTNVPAKSFATARRLDVVEVPKLEV